MGGIFVADWTEHAVNLIESGCHRRYVCASSCQFSTLSLRSTDGYRLKIVVAVDIWSLLICDWRVNFDS
jgi:hypothetical protein